MDLKKIGLILGGGGVKASSYIGLFKALDEAKIPIHQLAATSFGAIVGTFYAAGYSPEDMLTITQKLKRRTFYSIYDFLTTSHGFSSGKKFMRILKNNLGDIEFQDLSIPLKITCVDILSGKIIVFDKGPLLPILHASVSFPVFTAPVHYNGYILYSGTMGGAHPIELLKNKVDITLSAHIPCFDNFNQQHSFIRNMANSVRLIADELFQSKVQLDKPDIYIEPNLSHIKNYAINPDTIDYCYTEGLKETQKYIPLIKQLMRSKKKLKVRAF